MTSKKFISSARIGSYQHLYQKQVVTPSYECSTYGHLKSYVHYPL